jgi:hypothetical protein
MMGFPAEFIGTLITKAATKAIGTVVDKRRGLKLKVEWLKV